MPTYSYECPVHGEFEVTVPISAHRDHWPCPVLNESNDGVYACFCVTEQTYTPSRPKDWAIKPVVVHLGADGAVRFPANEHAPVPQGFNRVELKTLGEIETFERQVNQKLSSEAALHHEHEEQHFAALRAQLRGELRQRMQTMSPFGRDFAQFCIEENNRRARKKSDVGFHLEVLHFNQSNREAYRPGSGYKPTRWI